MDSQNKMTTSKYNVGPIRQLIDLNGDQTNFMLEFAVESDNKEPFDIIVLDQTTLDTQEPLNYKEVKEGFISGKIVADKNTYQNYYMVLKASKPTQCKVSLNFKPLPKTVAPPPPQQQITPPPQIKNDENGKSWLKYILIIAVIIGGGMLLYYFYKKSKNDTQKQSSKTSPKQSPQTSQKLVSKGSPHKNTHPPKKSPVPSVSSSDSSKHSTPQHQKTTFAFGKKPNQDLINRLKGLPSQKQH